ncbi:MAG: RDD family protein [Campylobacterota bacterium]|nr:RDD family protein [Campylobacterota bacterium]
MAKQRFRDIKKGNVQEIEEKPKKIRRKEGYIPYASIPDRIKAFITDQFMLMMPILYIVFYMVMGSREEFAANMMMGWVYVLVPNFIIVTLFLTLKGQTPGAKAYSLKLINREGHTPSVWAVMFRYYIELLGFITIIGIFIPFFRKDRKSLQDVISATHFISLD